MIENRKTMFNGNLGDLEYTKIGLLLWALGERSVGKKRRYLIYLNENTYISVRHDTDITDDKNFFTCFNIDDTENDKVSYNIERAAEEIEKLMQLKKNILMVEEIGKELYIDAILGEIPIYVDISYKGEMWISLIKEKIRTEHKSRLIKNKNRNRNLLSIPVFKN